MPDSWVVVPHEGKLTAYARFIDVQGAKRLKLIDKIYVEFDAAGIQYLFKTVPFSRQPAVWHNFPFPNGE